MRAVRRRVVQSIAIGAAVALIPLAVALACTPQAAIVLSAVEVAPGDTITVHGEEFVPRGDAEITIGGQPVGTASGAAFTTVVTIPNLAPGPHVVGATGYSRHGTVEGFASASIQIQGSAPTPGAPAGGGSEGSGAGSRGDTPPPGGGSAQTAAPGSESAAAPSPARSTAAARRTPARSGANADRRSAARGNANARRSAGSRTSARGRVAIAPQAPATVRTETGQRVFAGSVAQGRSSTGSRSATRTPANRPAAPVASPPRPAEQQNRGASLIPSAGEPAMEPSGGSGATLAAGAGLLGVGLVLLLGGFLAVEVRRRRALAHPDRH